MSLSEDLLAQSMHLATLDKGKPKQVNLRRAVSSAYYGLFHLLSNEASTRMSPGSPQLLAARVARSLDHGDMNSVCRTLSGGTPTAVMSQMHPGAFSPQLRNVARTFVALQAARHSADYDTAATATRSATLNLLESAQQAFSDWDAIRNTEEATVFLAALLFAKRWDR